MFVFHKSHSFSFDRQTRDFIFATIETLALDAHLTSIQDLSLLDFGREVLERNCHTLVEIRLLKRSLARAL